MPRPSNAVLCTEINARPLPTSMQRINHCNQCIIPSFNQTSCIRCSISKQIACIPPVQEQQQSTSSGFHCLQSLVQEQKPSTSSSLQCLRSSGSGTKAIYIIRFSLPTIPGSGTKAIYIIQFSLPAMPWFRNKSHLHHPVFIACIPRFRNKSHLHHPVFIACNALVQEQKPSPSSGYHCL